jgi:hypothetical protein
MQVFLNCENLFNRVENVGKGRLGVARITVADVAIARDTSFCSTSSSEGFYRSEKTYHRVLDVRVIEGKGPVRNFNSELKTAGRRSVI